MAVPQDNSWLYPPLGITAHHSQGTEHQACTSEQVTVASQQLAQPEKDEECCFKEEETDLAFG